MKTANRLVILALTLTCAFAAPLSAVAEPAASTSPEWSFTGVTLSSSRVTSGQPVTVEPEVSGDLDGATYNYVWQRGGSWAAGEWEIGRASCRERVLRLV